MSTTAVGNGLSHLRRVFLLYRQETGQPLVLWAIIALLQVVTQIVLRHELKSGDFGSLNTALCVIGLMTAPMLALVQGLNWYGALNHPASESARLEALRGARFLIIETLVWIWATFSFLSLFLVLPLLSITDFTVRICVLLNILASLGLVVSNAICEKAGHIKSWIALLLTCFVLRLLLGTGLADWQPVTASVLGAFILASFIPLVPVLRHIPAESAIRFQALRSLLDRDLLVYLSATVSVLVGVFLFINADRLVAQSWFGSATNNNFGLVNWAEFDAYQTAGLLGRSLLWGTQPLLFLWFAQRTRLDRTTTASMTFFWIYLGALVLGGVLLFILQTPLCRLFCGADYAETAGFVPIFIFAMMPLGLVQALAFFALASRRFQECFVIGGCSIAYTLLLYLVGREATIMPAYMFGGGLVALMILLFVGVVRWGRKQP